MLITRLFVGPLDTPSRLALLAAATISVAAGCGGPSGGRVAGGDGEGPATLPGETEEPEPTVLEAPEDPSDNVWTKTFPLGETVSADYHFDEFSSTGFACVASKRESTKLDQWSTRAQFSHSGNLLSSDIVMPQQSRRGLGGPELPKDPGVPASWRRTDESGAADTLEVLAKVKTIRREVTSGDGTGGETECPPEEEWDFSDFRFHCGVGYVGTHDYGGYIVLQTDVSELSGPQRERLADIFNVGDGTEEETGLREQMRSLADSDLPSLPFIFEMKGLPDPDQSLRRDLREITAENLVRYIDQLEESYSAALEQGTFPDESFGSLVEQSVDKYSKTDIETCGVGSVRETIECHNDFLHKIHRFRHPNGGLQRTLDRARWKLEHPNRVAWAEPRDESIAAYRSFIEDVEACEQTHSDRKDACRGVLHDDESGTICEACRLPTECRPDTLLDRHDKLPQTRVTAGPAEPLRHYRVGHNDRVTAGEISESPTYGEDVCVLTGVGGAFRSSNEQVRLSPDPEEGHWVLETQSERLREEEKMSATMACVSSHAFRTRGEPGWHRKTYSVETTDGKKQTEMSDGKYAVGLMGITGEMRGEDDMARASQFAAGNPSKLTAASESGSVASYGLSWGFDFPEGERMKSPRGSRLTSNGDSRSTLGSADDSLCFLTHVAGDFAGASEWVKVGIEDGEWYIEVHAECAESKGVLGLGSECRQRRDIRASARCISFDQYPDE